MTTANISPSTENAPLVATIDQLQGVIENFIELGVLVHDNQGTQQSHTALIHKTNQLIGQLGSLESNTDNEQYPIPIDVLTYIEDGRNPDIYTREFVESTAKSNAKLKGRMQAFAQLRDVLGEKLVQELPRLKDSVEEIKAKTS
ncbi:mediator of RNA polymerase II transcription subunit 10 [[Candida] railenensis]|uniref:Mediator of RNA polymerase II transcription subunit 10 n=1 Tax=[Candida] railenensis TaxID=45579 RepID=A0A9P0QLW3_9ASCO|nr:mediator of RNA polymerase II transcription subunit 10 [[Candida] railenensis]